MELSVIPPPPPCSFFRSCHLLFSSLALSWFWSWSPPLLLFATNLLLFKMCVLEKGIACARQGINSSPRNIEMETCATTSAALSRKRKCLPSWHGVILLVLCRVAPQIPPRTRKDLRIRDILRLGQDRFNVASCALYNILRCRQNSFLQFYSNDGVYTTLLRCGRLEFRIRPNEFNSFAPCSLYPHYADAPRVSGELEIFSGEEKNLRAEEEKQVNAIFNSIISKRNPLQVPIRIRVVLFYVDDKYGTHSLT